MRNLKVKHNAQGDHCPAEHEESAVYTEPYELQATIVFEAIEIGRNVNYVVWKEYYTGKRYRSSVYLLTDAASDKLDGEATVLFMKKTGLYITGRFGFEQRGNDVLLALLPPESAMNRDTVIEFAKETFEGILDGKLNMRHAKVHARAFLEYLKGKEDE